MNGSSRVRYMEMMTVWERVTKINRWEMTPEEMDGQLWRKKISLKLEPSSLIRLERIFIHKMRRCTEIWEKMKQTNKSWDLIRVYKLSLKKDWKRRSKKASSNFFKNYRRNGAKWRTEMLLFIIIPYKVTWEWGAEGKKRCVCWGWEGGWCEG